ncbi:MAG TPA: glycosyltransferase family 4 protein [Candidatus Limnocylindrales bacterium]|nr:glycosyltransferase family 4 protein [Candidatus Limnocylindrales bacterium]
MRIAQVSPLYESVPPRCYGGTERVVSWLTEELVQMGHEVTLYASGDSVTSARLVATCPRSLRLNESSCDQLAHHLVMLERLKREAHYYDIIHYHCDYMHFPFSRQIRTPHVTTLHGRLDIPDLVPLYREFSEMVVVSISNAQREPLPWLPWAGTVHHGLPPDMYELSENAEGYLAFLGRVSPEKGLDRAIRIATRLGWPLKIAAKVDAADRRYFEETIKPQLDRPGIEWIGEIAQADKQAFLGNAAALLFPIDWPEPFGLVMIEAMACGTPVIAFERGSVAEVIEDGVSGYVVRDIDGAVQAVARIDRLSRRRCRERFERRFVSSRMAREYVKIYESVAGRMTSSDPCVAGDTPGGSVAGGDGGLRLS